MRKLLYLAAGAALLSAPAAFAQDNSASPSNQPVPAASGPAQTAPADQAAPSDPSMAPSDQTAPPDQAAPPSQAAPVDQGAPVDQSAAPSQDQAGPPAQGPGSAGSNVRANQGSRLYVQQGETNGQSVQIISNAPVPDTHATRRMFPPLSRAGRATRPAGN